MLRYYTGKACPHGHLCDRRVKDYGCVDCTSERNKKFILARGGIRKRNFVPYEEIFDVAKRYKDRKTFRDSSQQHYMAASKRGILESVCFHMAPAKTRGVWTQEKAVQAALKFSIKSKFSKSHPGAVDAIKRMGIENECYSHMDKLKGDYDVVYMWGFDAIDGFYTKFGVTSKRLGFERIRSVSSRSGLPIKFIHHAFTPMATAIERELLCLGSNAEMSKFNGSSEFRLLTYHEFQKALEIIRKVRNGTEIERMV